MKIYAVLTAVVVIPVLVFLNVWQSFLYSAVKMEISRMESQQKDLLERNKRSITGISVLESPERIEGLAKDRLRLERPIPGLNIYIQPKKSEKDTDG